MSELLKEHDIYNQLEVFRQLNNDYIYTAILEFIKGICPQINNRANEYKTDASLVLADVLSYLKKINFMAAYTSKKFPTDESGFDLNQEEFKKYVYESVPALKTLAENSTLNVIQPKDEWISKLEEIKDKFKQYKHKNKKGFVTSFNKEVDALIDSINEKGLNEANPANNMERICMRLQNDEDCYYNNLKFFANSRRAHSSLQKHITDAFTEFNTFKRQR